MTNKVHVVPHMHWDREWYFTAEESKLLLINNMEEIMERLETDPNYPYYVLDGQTSVLEDYFGMKPENRDRVKKLVQAGKLIIGPWYTQTDEMVVGGESIVRNLLYGHKDCKEFGPVMDIGYLPDSFGQSGQMPMILNGFNIKRSMFWRGTSERMGSSNTEFYWTSDDGSKVLTQLLPLGYAIGKYLPVEKEALAVRCSKYMPVLERGATGENLLLPNGHDQMPIQKDIYEVMDQLKNIYPKKDFFLSNYDLLFKELEKKDDYDTLHGELLDGKYMRVHRSIFSSRADIKAINTVIENKITNILEPLASIAHTLGFEYFHGMIESIWKEIMKNHAHDSIGCCCSDKVHAEIMARFELANEKVDRTIDFYKRKIADAMSLDISLDKFVAYNLLPYTRNTVVRGTIITRMKNFVLQDENGNNVPYHIVEKEEIDAGLIDRQIVHYGNYDPFVQYVVEVEDTIPSMGYKTYFVIEGDANMSVSATNDTTLENEYYTITVNPNGTLAIVDKELNDSYDSVLLLEDGSDDGDGYDYSPLLDDYVITSKDVKATTSIVKSTLSTTATIAYTFEVPANLDSRKAKVIDSSVDVSFTVTLTKGSKNIAVSMTLDNKAKDHRVRALIPTAMQGKFSVSDNQFGIIERAVRDDAMDIWEKEKWSERPDAIYPMLGYVAIKDCPIAVLTNSIREFEIIGDNYNTLAITLFRSTGYLGKEELVRRPGRPSGIKMPTPDQQLLTKMTFDFALVTEKDQTVLARRHKEYVTPVVTYNKMPYNAMKLNDVDFTVPYSHSLIEQTDKNIILSVLKKAENSNDLVYRVFNTSKNNVTLEVNKNVLGVINLNEEVSQEEKAIKYNQVKTFLIEK